MDRVLYTSTVYPSNYGFIPRTLADDGDPLDVLVLCNEPIYPMTLVTCMPIGVIVMTDSGELDEKIIAVPVNDPNYKHYYDIKELPSHVFEEMMHFLRFIKCSNISRQPSKKCSINTKRSKSFANASRAIMKFI